MNNQQPIESEEVRLQGFIDDWKQEFNEELTTEQARMELNRLMEFYSELAKWVATQPRSDTDGAGNKGVQTP